MEDTDVIPHDVNLWIMRSASGTNSSDYYDPAAMYFSPRFKGIVFVSKASALISIISSAIITIDIFHKSNGRPMIASLIMIALSASDIINSFCQFIGSWGAPKGMIFMAAGNEATCTVQAIFHTFSLLCCVMYSSALVWSYTLNFRFGWSVRRIQDFQPILLFFPFAFAFVITIMSAIALRTNPYSTWGYCIFHNDESNSFQTVIKYIQDLVVIISTLNPTVLMILLYCTVIREGRVTHSNNSNRTTAHSRRVAIHGMRYAAVYLLVWLPIIVIRVFDLYLTLKPIALFLLVAITFPLQGFFNASIYFGSVCFIKRPTGEASVTYLIEDSFI